MLAWALPYVAPEISTLGSPPIQVVLVSETLGLPQQACGVHLPKGKPFMLFQMVSNLG